MEFLSKNGVPFVFPVEIEIKLSSDHVYNALVDFLKTHPFNENDEIINSSKPSFIKLKKSGFWPWQFANIRIHPQRDRSRILIDFDFKAFLALWLGITFIGIIIMIIGFSIRGSTYEPYLGWLILVGFALAEIGYTRNMFKEKISAFFKGIESLQRE